MKYKVLLVFFLMSPVGCMSALQVNVQNESDYKLCSRIATVPSYNINYENTQKEIRKRSVNCSQYAAEIRLDQKLKRMEEKIDEANRLAERAESRAARIERQKRYNQINDYSDLVCKHGRVMTQYGCRYR